MNLLYFGAAPPLPQVTVFKEVVGSSKTVYKEASSVEACRGDSQLDVGPDYNLGGYRYTVNTFRLYLKHYTFDFSAFSQHYGKKVVSATVKISRYWYTASDDDNCVSLIDGGGIEAIEGNLPVSTGTTPLSMVMATDQLNSFNSVNHEIELPGFKGKTFARFASLRFGANWEATPAYPRYRLWNFSNSEVVTLTLVLQ